MRLNTAARRAPLPQPQGRVHPYGLQDRWNRRETVYQLIVAFGFYLRKPTTSLKGRLDNEQLMFADSPLQACDACCDLTPMRDGLLPSPNRTNDDVATNPPCGTRAPRNFFLVHARSRTPQFWPYLLFLQYHTDFGGTPRTARRAAQMQVPGTHDDLQLGRGRACSEAVDYENGERGRNRIRNKM